MPCILLQLLETLKEDAELVSTLEKCLKAGQPLARDQVRIQEYLVTDEKLDAST